MTKVAKYIRQFLTYENTGVVVCDTFSEDFEITVPVYSETHMNINFSFSSSKLNRFSITYRCYRV